MEDLRSDVLEGHLSTLGTHGKHLLPLGTLPPSQVHEAIQDRGQEAEDTFERFSHLAANDLLPREMGPWLELYRTDIIGNSEFTTMAINLREDNTARRISFGSGLMN